MSTQRYAIIDIGTVSCRLYIADIIDDELFEVYRDCVICDLGLGVASSGYLSSDAIARVDACVAEYKERIAEFSLPGQSMPVIVSATSASRDAKNAEVFAQMIVGHGLELSIISGVREAELSFKGASLCAQGDMLMVVDIGGGSTELILGQPGAAPLCAHSFDVGCRRVTELFLQSDPPRQEEIDAARHWIVDQMKEYISELMDRYDPADELIAVAGTATSAVALVQKLEPYDSNKVHGFKLTKEKLTELRAHMEKLTVSQRAALPGLQPKRAGVILAGLYILETILDLSGLSVCTVSESDGLQGSVYDAYERGL